MKRTKGKGLLEKLAGRLYKRLKSGKFSYMYFPKQVQQDIQLLDREEEAYYIQKLMYVCGFSLGGAALAVTYAVWLWGSSSQQVTELRRPEAYEETEEVTLRAGRYEEEYHLMVEPIRLTREEAEQQLEELLASWEPLILGANESMDKIQYDLILPEHVEGYPFEIYWESDKEQLIDTIGMVNREGLEEDSIVVLTAVIYYQEFMWTEQFAVLVLREELTEEERYKRAFGVFLEDSEETQQGEPVWALPDSFEENSVGYQRVTEKYELLILAALMPVVGLAIWFGQDQDLHSSRNKRQAIFQAEYVSFAGSLSLYISAGLNLQMAMQLCTQDYVKRKPKEHLLRAALLAFQKDIQNGIGFLEAMERFAAFTDHLDYRRLAGLLSQGLVNGSKGLAAALEQEVDKTREEKRRQCKVAGEQASTALIAPMLLQLGIVIALIMIPAFTGMEF